MAINLQVPKSNLTLNSLKQEINTYPHKEEVNLQAPKAEANLHAPKTEILIVDDEADIRNILKDIFEENGYVARVAKNSTEALDAINRRPCNVVLLDGWLKGSAMDGLSILDVIKQKYPTMPVVMMSGHGNIETAVSAIKSGAYDYIEKPFLQEKALLVVARALEAARLAREVQGLKSKVAGEAVFVGNSRAIKKLESDIMAIAPSSGRVLISGQPGSDQEAVARRIHDNSTYAHSGPFIQFTPANKTASEINATLFGEVEIENMHRIRQQSIFEQANRGTLYIHSVEDLPLESQQKLSDILQRKVIINYINNEEVPLDVRIICSTSKNLPEAAQNGQFNQDLLRRISLLPLKIPSLDDRREDIAELVNYYLNAASHSSGLKNKRFSRQALNLFQYYSKWQGLTHLKNVVEWCLVMDHEPGDMIQVASLPKEIIQSNITGFIDSSDEVQDYNISLRDATEKFQLGFIYTKLYEAGGNVTKTAECLGIERSALHRKIKYLEDKALGNSQLFGSHLVHMVTSSRRSSKRKGSLAAMLDNALQENNNNNSPDNNNINNNNGLYDIHNNNNSVENSNNNNDNINVMHNKDSYPQDRYDSRNKWRHEINLIDSKA